MNQTSLRLSDFLTADTDESILPRSTPSCISRSSIRHSPHPATSLRQTPIYPTGIHRFRFLQQPFNLSNLRNLQLMSRAELPLPHNQQDLPKIPSGELLLTVVFLGVWAQFSAISSPKTVRTHPTPVASQHGPWGSNLRTKTY